MANKNNNSNQTITLPQGGAAPAWHRRDLLARSPYRHRQLHGAYCAAGRNGFQLQLNLVYSTGNGNSPFGLGWGLSCIRQQR